MHLGIDARMIDHSGIGVYLRQLVQGLLAADDRIRITLFGNVARLADLAGDRCRLVPFQAPIYGLAERRGWPREADQCDVLHAPHYCAPGHPPRPLVITVHDLIHFLGPGELRGIRRWWGGRIMRAALAAAAEIICDSEATRSDLQRAFPKVRSTHVIPLAPDPWFLAAADRAAEESWRREMEIPRQHWLSVGIDKPHKRHRFTLELLARLRLECGMEIPWVIVGPRDESFRWAHADHIAPIEDLLVMPGWIPPMRLPAVYRGAAALLIPSVREGFGLPVVEAMAAGCPVLAADAGSLSEVVGDGGALLPPNDAWAWVRAMDRVVHDEVWRERLIERGREWVKRFSWETTARRTLEVFQHVAQSARHLRTGPPPPAP